jgi:Flp pilus assembly protein TadG
MSAAGALSPLRKLRCLLRDRSGVSALEFGMTAPILLIVVMGTLEMSHGFYVATVLQGSVNSAARKSSLQTGQTSSTALDALVTQMVKYVAPAANVTFVRKNYTNFSNVGTPEDFTDTNKNGKYDATECFVDMNANGVWDADMGVTGLGGANDAVAYTVTVTYKQLFGFGTFLGLPANQTMHVTTILKNQPFATQSTRTGTQICP